MKWTPALAVLPGLAATVLAAVDQSGVLIGAVTPQGEAPEGAITSSGTNFYLVAQNDAANKAKRDNAKDLEVCPGEKYLVMSLDKGTLSDAKGRVGYIADNAQLQFDNPAQAGAVYNSGFSITVDGRLALGSKAEFDGCVSGEFSNIYNKDGKPKPPQCKTLVLKVVPCKAMASEDEQPSVPVAGGPVPVCQIGDGQIQIHTKPCGPVVTPKPVPTKTAEKPSEKTSVPPVTETKPAETKPVESKPAESKPAETPAVPATSSAVECQTCAPSVPASTASASSTVSKPASTAESATTLTQTTQTPTATAPSSTAVSPSPAPTGAAGKAFPAAGLAVAMAVAARLI